MLLARARVPRGVALTERVLSDLGERRVDRACETLGREMLSPPDLYALATSEHIDSLMFNVVHAEALAHRQRPADRLRKLADWLDEHTEAWTFYADEIALAEELNDE